MTRALVLAVFAVGCSGLDAIEPGICGNRVIDLGEDCDGSPQCEACNLRCSNTSETRCPAGYTCGKDNFCHAPGGHFTLAVFGTPFSANEYRTADGDGDGYDDVIAIGTTSISAHLGDLALPLAIRIATPTPNVKGSAAFVELDGRFGTDIVLPTNDGLVAYSNLVAFPFPSNRGPENSQTLGMYAIDPESLEQHKRGVIFAAKNGELVLDMFDVATGDLLPDEVAVCGPGADKGFDPERVDSYRVDTTNGFVMTYALVLAEVQGGRLCMFQLVYDRTAMAPYSVQLLAPPTTMVSAVARAVLADLSDNLTPCPGLVVRDTQLVYFPPTGNVTCAISQTPTFFANPPIGPFEIEPIGRLPLLPAIGGAAPEALVLTSGIYKVEGTTLQPLHQVDQPISRVIAAKLERSDKVDAVITARDETDLDVLYRVANGFLAVRIATEGTVGPIAAGDFDGNTHTDLVFASRSVFGDRLLVAYGTPDRLLEPVEAARFGRVVALAPVQVKDSGDEFEIVEDLAVLDQVFPMLKPRITALHGNAGRTMIPYFTPRAPGASYRFHAVIAGPPKTAPPPLPEMPPQRPALSDLYTIDTALAAAPGDPSFMWKLVGRDDELVVAEEVLVSPVAQCKAGAPEALCEGARYIEWAGRMIALDPYRNLVSIDPTPIDCEDSGDYSTCDAARIERSPAVGSMTQRGQPRSLFGFDLDRDATRELVLSYGMPPPSMPRGHVLICDVDAYGVAQSCADAQALISAFMVGGAPSACVDAAHGIVTAGGRFTPAPEQDLLVMCHHGDGDGAFTRFYVVMRTQGGYYVAPFDDLLFPGGHAESFTIGDVTADGVPDVIVVSASSEGRTLNMFRQLTSREAATRGPPGPIEGTK